MFGVTNDVRPDLATSSPRRRRRDATRAEILEAAWELCREQGLAALSLRDLAGRVGLRAPSLYSYFDSKVAIYDAMFRQGYEVFAARLDERIGDQPASRSLLRAGVHTFFDFCAEDPVRYQLLFQRTIPDFEPSPESYAVAVDVLDGTARALEELGVDDPRHVDLWTAMFTGLISQQLANDPGGDRWGRLLDEALDLFCDHVGIPTEEESP